MNDEKPVDNLMAALGSLGKELLNPEVSIQEAAPEIPPEPTPVSHTKPQPTPETSSPECPPHGGIPVEMIENDISVMWDFVCGEVFTVDWVLGCMVALWGSIPSIPPLDEWKIGEMSNLAADVLDTMRSTSFMAKWTPALRRMLGNSMDNAERAVMALCLPATLEVLSMREFEYDR